MITELLVRGISEKNIGATLEQVIKGRPKNQYNHEYMIIHKNSLAFLLVNINQAKNEEPINNQATRILFSSMVSVAQNKMNQEGNYEDIDAQEREVLSDVYGQQFIEKFLPFINPIVGDAILITDNDVKKYIAKKKRTEKIIRECV